MFISSSCSTFHNIHIIKIYCELYRWNGTGRSKSVFKPSQWIIFFPSSKHICSMCSITSVHTNNAITIINKHNNSLLFNSLFSTFKNRCAIPLSKKDAFSWRPLLSCPEEIKTWWYIKCLEIQWKEDWRDSVWSQWPLYSRSCKLGPPGSLSQVKSLKLGSKTGQVF